MSNESIWKVGDVTNAYWIAIDETVMKVIAEFRQYKYFSDLEACGVLLGERRGPHIKVTHLTTPFSTDIRTPTHYDRSTIGHQAMIDHLHQESNGIIQYLGEWHTHPQVHAKPSIEDYMEWAKSIEGSENRMEKRLFFIAGTETDYLGVYENSILSPTLLIHHYI